AMSETARAYRFAPLDRSGLLLGLGGVQCALVAAGIFVAGLLLDAGVPPLVALPPVIALSAGALVRWHGRGLHEWAPLLARFAVQRFTRRHRWVASIPLLTGAPSDQGREPPLPPFLRGLTIIDAGAVS